jgi:hypothetical protein
MRQTRSKSKSYCKNCGNETARTGYTYCSNSCQQEYQYQEFIKRWKEGKVTGLRNIGVVSKSIKRYLRQKYNNRCVLCGWSEVNRKTGLVPLVADHIDGDWKNNSEENLRLICPNCDSLTPTYAALNKGNGRKDRAKSLRPTVRGYLR